MALLEADVLRRLGRGERIAAVCDTLGLDRAEFDRRWRETCAARVPRTTGESAAHGLRGPVSIRRDRWGIPHVRAEHQDDLFFGFGYALAQDRLFQLDWLRRKGLGRLAEILGPDGLEFDLVARTVGLNRIAAAELALLPPETRRVLESFAAGINALIEESGDRLPIEFALLDYRTEPWTPLDSLAIESEFRWYLTGRFPILAIPEVARRTLGEGPLYRDFLLCEADEEPILQPGEYVPGDPRSAGALRGEPVGHSLHDPQEGTGSNNWVLSGARTTTGGPLLASDPHIAMEAVSCWWEVHLSGGGFDVCGIAYAGIPAVMFGRNRRVAWGITNNICSQRDLYQERTDPAHPGCFAWDGAWEPAKEIVETIAVRGAAPVTKTVRLSRNGPVVDEILPAPVRDTGPVTIKWLGAHAGGFLTALLDMDRATDVDSFRAALRPWHVPTFSVVFADVAGRIGLHAAGRIPIRASLARGYRPGWDPAHAWQGLIPFEEMPRLADPPRGWIATANNRVAADDFPRLLHGCWSSGYRARRIREMIGERDRHSLDDFRAMQHDVVSLRAQTLVPDLVAALQASPDPRVHDGARRLRTWDGRMTVDSQAATLFALFFARWCRTVAEARFGAAHVDFVAPGLAGLAGRLLRDDPHGWFAPGERLARIVRTFEETLDEAAARFGPDPAGWAWAALHRMPLRHVLSARGDLGALLDAGGPHGIGVKGDVNTVCNTGWAPDGSALMGAGYRLLADLRSDPPVLLAVDVQSQSGHPGSPHYADQIDAWTAGEYHAVPLDEAEVARGTVETLTLAPRV